MEKEIKLPNKSKCKVKKDQYSRARGGKTEILQVSCALCSGLIMIYQKDGPGPLLRAYLDRIVWPPEYTGLEQTPKNELPNLTCLNAECRQVIGSPMVYTPEDRLAMRLNQGTFRKSRYEG